MTRRVLIAGADAAGMSAAHQALRTARARGVDLEVRVAEKTGHTSYSACGIPYWIAGEAASGDALVARTAEQHRAAGVDLRLDAEVVAADLAARTATVRTASGEEVWTYDDLVVATGATAHVPAWARESDGRLIADVGPVKTLDDGAAWLDRMAGRPMGRVVVAGGGYIGVEMAEAARRRGYEVTLVTRSRVLSGFEPELSARIAAALEQGGVEVCAGSLVTGLCRDETGAVVGVETTAGRRPGDLVMVALGIEPNTGFLAGQAELSPKGYLRPDPQGRVQPGLWAAGDCCEVRQRLTDTWVPLALGTHANKHGRALGDALAGGDLHFDGALGSMITRFAAGAAYAEIATTGLSLATARASGLDAEGLLTEGTTASGYLPEAEPIAIHVVAERGTRRLLGVQIVGGHGAGKRVDTAAAVLWLGGTVDALAWMDLSYAPPFATAWEILQVAARRLAERL